MMPSQIWTDEKEWEILGKVEEQSRAKVIWDGEDKIKYGCACFFPGGEAERKLRSGEVGLVQRSFNWDTDSREEEVGARMR